MFVSSARRPHLALAVLLALVVLFFIHDQYQPQSRLFSFRQKPILAGQGLEESDYRIRKRVDKWRDICQAPDPLEEQYGRTNLRLSRGYEGSHHRFRGLLQKILRGEQITISAIGGSVTKGHHVQPDQIWFWKFGEWLQSFAGSDIKIEHVNGAAPATGSDYFSFCFPLHIPLNSDLVLVELAVNDEGILEHIENMENLLRGLLDLPTKPAVMLVEAMAFSNGGMGGGGGRMHLPVAQYYDVPVINQRHPLANHFARYPQLVRPYFAWDWWGNPDGRHIDVHGHRDLGMLVASFVRDSACTMISESTFMVNPANSEPSMLALEHGVIPLSQAEVGEDIDPKEFAKLQDVQISEAQITWPEDARSWRNNPPEGQEVGELMPGIWMGPNEYGIMPRMRILEGWNPNLDHYVPPFHPTCLSTRSTIPEYNLTPTANDGWEYWIHPEHTDKPYLIARQPGSRVSFELKTGLGVVKMYSLRSKTFGLGTVECWVGDERSMSVKVEGYWDNGDANIGRFSTIREDLAPGTHTVTCELLEETGDPGDGHEFRMISMMSV